MSEWAKDTAALICGLTALYVITMALYAVAPPPVVAKQYRVHSGYHDYQSFVSEDEDWLTQLEKGMN